MGGHLMPILTFKGFQTGPAVGISATQASATESGSVPSWGEPVTGNGVVTASAILPPRIVAPAGVWLTALGTSGFAAGAPSGGATYDPRYHEITYIWDTGDTGVWNALENTLSQWNDKSLMTGPRGAHVYDTPGTYTPTASGFEVAGESGQGSTASFEVLDPDDVYSGAATVCIALDGNFTGAPSGAQQVTSLSGLQSAINNANTTPTRILFKRGETYDGVAMNCRNDEIEYIGAWGLGDRPILVGKTFVGGNDRYFFTYAGNDDIEQITCTDLEFRGDWDPVGEVGFDANMPFWMWGVESNNVVVTIHNCKFSGCDKIYLSLGSSNDRPGTVIVADCEVTDWRDYGFFIHRNSNPAARVGIVGTKIAQNPNAVGGTNYQTWDLDGNQHGPIRFEDLGEFYCGASDLFSCTGWSYINDNQAPQACIRVNTYADDAKGAYLNVERCVLEGGTEIVNMAGENSGRVEEPGNYIFDRVIMVGCTKSAQASRGGCFVTASFGGTTIRNNYFYMPDVPHYQPTGNASENVISFHQHNPSPDNPDEPVAVYNCTFLNDRGTANDPSFEWHIEGGTASQFNNITIENNVRHAPGLDLPVTGDGPVATGSFPGISLRYAGVVEGINPITGNTSVSNNSYFAIPYPSGTNQAFWQANAATDTRHVILIGGTKYYGGNGDIEADFSQSNEIRIYNRSGGTWSGSYQLRLDRSSTIAADGTYATPTALPLPRPTTGSSALNSADVGFRAYDDLLGHVRPTTGNDRGAFLE